MPTKRFALKRGEKPRLELRWRGIWKDITILLDGTELDRSSGMAAIKAGRDVELPDGLGTLHVQLVQSFGSAELQVLRNGQPLPGSGSDPDQRLAGAWGVLLFVAGLNIVLGLVAVFFDVGLLKTIGVGWESIAEGVVFGGLAYAVRRWRSAIALGIAMAIFAIDGVLGIVASIGATSTPPIGGIFFRVMLLIAMFRGFGAIRAIKERDRGDRAAATFE